MLFPQAAKSQFFNEKYQTKVNYEGYSLVEFFNLIKNGNEDVRVSSAPLMEKEEYALRINDDGISISASCDEGLYRAATSLWQLIRKQKGQICFAEIEDKPQLPRRGYMLDISRGRMPTVETIKTIIDFLSALKYNEFQLYMEGECFKYSAFPKYTEDFDCLSAEDMEELDRYCSERFMDLVPNQNSLGHLYPWFKHEEFKPIALCGDDDAVPSTLNPLLDESYEFIDKVYESVLPHFKSEYVNIGLDEAYGLGRYQIEEYCKIHGKDMVFMEWLNKLNSLIKEKYDKKIMFWSDMIYGSEKLYDMIPSDAVVLEWGYELIQSQQMTEHCITFRNAGLNYYVCPSCNTHLSFTGRFDVTSFNIRTAAELAVRFGASGMLLTDWGNGGHPHFGVWSMVPCALAGQYGWNTGGEQNGENFKADFIRNAERYVDETVFGGAPVSRLMYRMGNYYLLEPERVHVGTMCGELFNYPITQTNYAHLFDLKDSGDSFYFDNITEYVTKIMKDFEKLDFDPQLKREILLNSQMVILSSEICKVRIGEVPSNEKIDELVSLIDHVAEEYCELWCKRNFEKGTEKFLTPLNARRSELLALKN